MRDLVTLQSSPAGRRLLDKDQIYCDPELFLNHLQSARSHPNDEQRPVYTHQQIYLDYKSSVVAKVLALRNLQRRTAAIKADFIWIDTDRAASDKLAMRLYLPGEHGMVPVRLAPSGCDGAETRFIQMDPARLNEAIRRMEVIIRQMPGDMEAKRTRFDRFKDGLRMDGTLADLGRSIADLLFTEALAFQPRPVAVSTLIVSGDLIPVLERILNRQREFVETVNTRIKDLQALDVAPQLKPLADDYLPLFITCPDDGSRLRLHLQRDGKDHHAVAYHRSGRRSCYELGRSTLTIATLERDARWSPDVTLPLLINDNYSGMVAGKSSALYMLIFNEVMRTVLDMVPIPILVPSTWHVFSTNPDSLFCAYLNEQRL
ncbi:MAG: hypothetical protein ACE363_03835 [Alphaproteobacteria bacterium]